MRAPAGMVILPAMLLACGGGLSPEALEAAAGDCDALEARPFPGEPAPLVALNAYYLQEEAARALRRGEAQSAVVEEILSEAAALGVRAIRTNGFNDDPAKAGDSAIQVAPLAYDEVALRGLDLVLARARAHGLRLVLPLGNHWDAYGGARQYVAWAGLADPRTGDPRFYEDEAVVALYEAHLERLLSRVSTVDGLRYGDHPAVLAFELLNEPRGPGRDDGGAALRAWIDRIGARVKALAPGHLVGTGEEGFDGPGQRFALDTASPYVDYGSVHLYPEDWGVPADEVAGFGAAWIAGHARVAAGLGKPVLLGEFGLRGDGLLGLAERRAVYRGWLGCARRSGLAGAAAWLYVPDAVPGRAASWDPYAFGWLDGTAPEDPRNEYVDLLLAAARGG